MQKKQVNTDPNSLSGRHIYRDDKGRVLYYKERALTGYIIKAENVAKYRQLSSRHTIGILGAMVGALLFEQWGLHPLLGVALGAICWTFMEYQFRTSFLANLVQVHNFIPKEKPTLLDALARENKNRLILKAILYMSFAVLLMIDIYVYLETTTLMQVAAWIISAIAFGIAILNLYAFVYQKKNIQKISSKSKKSKS